MKKWYNIELTREEWEEFRWILKRDGEEVGEPWKYEASGAGELIHIEIECLPSELRYLNELLSEIF